MLEISDKEFDDKMREQASIRNIKMKIRPLAFNHFTQICA